MTPLFLAVDGGNSKTDVVLGTVTGTVLAFARGPGSSPHSLGVPGAMRLLDSLVADARAAADLPAGTRVDQVSVYLAGADLPVEVQRLHAAVDTMGWARSCVVDNDTFALMRAGTASPDAVAVVCGAGINCVGRTTDGRSARFLSLGEISGDWGGGQHLAELALWYAARGEDGRGRPTALSAAVARHFGRPTVESVSEGLHLGEIPVDRVGELSPVLFAVAAAGDAVAGEVVGRQVEEVLALHRVAAGRLGLRDAPHAVVLGGGVLRARHPQLHEPVLAGVRAYAPRAEVTVVTAPPVVGAALLALDALGAGPGAEPALRAALRRPPDTRLPRTA
ncbi:N-acetylglucosamine kinase [Planosporangium sp. 12N6]|uniref:N-acetylglucosamine kinase n=1 Tax=Planosporangium spinosum TaxID=3402278 RepID=UPI003CF119A8